MTANLSPLLGHRSQIDLFQRAQAKGKLANSFIFVGPAGIGKRKFARLLAQSLLCDSSEAKAVAPCNTCSTCKQVIADNHPDLLSVAKPENRSNIPLDLLIGEGEMRMKEGLCHDLFVRPVSGKRRIAIIDDADQLAEEGANALLKTLEEPPNQAIIILLSTSTHRQLPTILSRCQVVRFAPLTSAQVATILGELQQVDDANDIQEAARFSTGSIEVANVWLHPESRSFRGDWLELVSNEKNGPQARIPVVHGFVEGAGKERRDKIPRLQLAIQLTQDFFRAALREKLAQPMELDSTTQAAVTRFCKSKTASIEFCTAAIERTMLASQHLSANAHLPTLIETWLMDLDPSRLLHDSHRTPLFSSYDGLMQNG